MSGSIGVVGGKFVTTAFWEQFGITWDTAQAGKNALLWSSGADFSPEQWAQFQGWLDRVYEDFTAKVAEGRGLSRDQVHAVAKGRIWTGEDAVKHGLVDELGGVQTALDLVREALELEADAPIHLKVFPKEKTLLELVMEKGLVRTLSNGDVLQEVIANLQPVLRVARAIGLGQQRRLPHVRGTPRGQ